MKRVLVISAVSMMGLMACGPGAKIGNGKQGAAEALFGASKATGSPAQKQAGGVDLSGGLSFSCPEGGTAEMTGFGVAIDTTGGAKVNQSFTIKYNDCGAAKSDQGVAKFNGSWTVTQGVIVNGTEVRVDQKFVGKILVQGAFDDFIDANVSQSVKVSDLSTSGVSVSMTLNGSITDSSGKYDFNEAINVNAGSLTADISKK